MSTVDHLRDCSEFSFIESNVRSLTSEKNRIIPPVAFLKASLEPGVQEKLDGSFSGHAVSYLIRASAQLAVLAVSRFWDGKPPKPIGTLNSILSLAPRIEDARKKEHPDWEDSWLEIGRLRKKVSETIKMAEDFVSSSVFRHARVYRTENLAHGLEGASRDRTKFGLGDDPITLKLQEIVDASEKSIDILDRVKSHWNFHIENSRQSLDVQLRYCRMFWNLLPDLKSVEDAKILFAKDEPTNWK